VRGGDEGRFRDLLQRGVSAARRAGVDLMLADQQFYLEIPDQARYERFVGVVGSVAASSKVALFSRYRMMKAWHASHPDYLNRMLSKDRFHMGDDGYRCWGRIMAHAIASALPSAMLVGEERDFSPYRTHAWLRF
jgi:lysophospholipase L1-like esterase